MKAMRIPGVGSAIGIVIMVLSTVQPAEGYWRSFHDLENGDDGKDVVSVRFAGGVILDSVREVSFRNGWTIKFRVPSFALRFGLQDGVPSGIDVPIVCTRGGTEGRCTLRIDPDIGKCRIWPEPHNWGEWTFVNCPTEVELR